jgi:hypothetical protein
MTDAVDGDWTRRDNAMLNAVASLDGDGPFTDRDAVIHAVDRLTHHAGSMWSSKGVFPLPEATPDSVLALIGPNDLIVLSGTLTLLGKDRHPHTFSTALSATGARVVGHTKPAGPSCFAYAMTFARHAFQASLSSSACHRAGGWQLTSTP